MQGIVSVCVGGESTHYKTVQTYLPERNIVTRDYTQGPLVVGLLEGLCNIKTDDDGPSVTESYAREAGYNGSYVLGTNVFSKELLSVVTRGDDPRFSDFVDSVFQALFLAEYRNISAEDFPQTNVFGEDFVDMYTHALSVAGNYGDIYKSSFDLFLERFSMNYVNNGTTGLMWSHPFGIISNSRDVQKYPLSPTMNAVLRRGVLRCGIRLERPGFAAKSNASSLHYTGMEIDYCRAMAASLFRGYSSAVEFIELPNIETGYAWLVSGDLDVLTGASRTLQAEVQEPSTGHGFAFSIPYFYGYSEQEDNLCLATVEDHDWAAFVYWIVTATVYAEEEGISKSTSNRMPEVYVYGRELKRMFRDSILFVGNYGDIYNRNVQDFIPRSGRNMLNKGPHLTPQHYIMPGFL